MAGGLNQTKDLEIALSLHGGMNAEDRPWMVAEPMCALLENMEVDKAGARLRRRGVQSIVGASGATSLMQWQGMAPHFDYLYQGALVAVAHSNVYLIPGTGDLLNVATSVSCVGDALHGFTGGFISGANQPATFIYTLGRGSTNQSHASNVLALYADRSYTQCASMAPHYAVWWGSRLWCADNYLKPDDQTIWWSGLNDGLNFSNSNTIRVEPGRGGRVTALLPIRKEGNTMIVFKERLIATFTAFWGTSSAMIPANADALDTIQSYIAVVADQWGCIAPASLQSTGGSPLGDAIFLSHDGFRTLKRIDTDIVGAPSLPISRPISPYIRRINMKRAGQAVSAVWERRYYCAVPLDDATENNYVLSVDLDTGGWAIHTLPVRDLAAGRLDSVDKNDFLYMQANEATADTTPSSAAAVAWHVFRAFDENAYTDPGGDSIVYKEDSRGFHFGQIMNEKRWEWLALMGYANNATSPVDVLVKVDNDRWTYVGQLIYEEVGGVKIVLGTDPLPWEGRPNGLALNKLSLSDIDPGFTLQVRLTQTNATDVSRPNFSLLAVAARIIDPVFDNTI